MNNITYMPKGFWEQLKKPFFVLAPMADVTDVVFRRMIAKYSEHGTDHGGPDVFWTEFVSADGLCSPGRDALLTDLRYDEEQRPIVAQIFSGNPERMREAARFVAGLGFDGIDINMGCPDRSIEKQGAGAALIKDPDRAIEIIKATQEGVADAGKEIPVSVKTRLGYNKDEIDTWVPALLATGIPVLAMHARTRKEMSLVPARWADVARVVAIRDRMGADTLIVGNGDVGSIEEAEQRVRESGADGAMIGRGIFGNPWFFNRSVKKEGLSLDEQFRVMIEHTTFYEEMLAPPTGEKNFSIMKKHYKAYVNGFDGAKELRVKLMEAKTASEVSHIAHEFLQGYQRSASA